MVYDDIDMFETSCIEGHTHVIKGHIHVIIWIMQHINVQKEIEKHIDIIMTDNYYV